MNVDDSMREMRRALLNHVDGMPLGMAIEALVAQMAQSSEDAAQHATVRPSIESFSLAVSTRAFTEGLRLAAALVHQRAVE